MSVRSAATAVVASAPVTALTSGGLDAVLSLILGLIGVLLARTVFVDKENRRLKRKQGWRETLPLTLVALLIAGVWIWDRQLGLSAAVFTGLGVGWVAILMLDIIGKRAIDAVRLLLGADPRDGLPDTMRKPLEDLDKVE